jgi:hypothetical protein
MLWSSYGPNKYATGIAVSTTGRVAGPWVQQAEPLWLEDGGHPMLFNTFDGRLVMTLHQPNRRVERARFFEMEDTGTFASNARSRISPRRPDEHETDPVTLRGGSSQTVTRRCGSKRPRFRTSRPSPMTTTAVA